MNGQGIMGLPPGMGGMPMGGVEDLSPLLQAQEVTRTVGRGPISRELLDSAADIDPFEVQEFLKEIQDAGLTEDDRRIIRKVVDRVKADYANYPRVRQELLAEGIEEDLLPEEFDPEFFLALELALEVPAGASPAMPEEMPVQGFAEGGVVSLPQMQALAQEMSKMGRGGDTMLAHITPAEAQLLKRYGGAGTINPYTGLPEFIRRALKKVGRAVKKFAKSTVGRVVIGVAAGMILGPAAVGFLQGTGVALSAAATTALTAGTGAFVSGLAAGDGLKNSFKAALGAAATGYVGASVFGAPGVTTTPTTPVGPTSFTEGLQQGWANARQTVSNLLGTSPTEQAVATPSTAPVSEAAPVGTATDLVDYREIGAPATPVDYTQSGDYAALREAGQGQAFPTPPRSEIDLAAGTRPGGGIMGDISAVPPVTPATPTTSPGMFARAQEFVRNPSFDALSDVLIDPNARTTLGKYAPLALTGTAVLGATGAFKTPETEAPGIIPSMTGEDYLRENASQFGQVAMPRIYEYPSVVGTPSVTTSSALAPTPSYASFSGVPVQTYDSGIPQVGGIPALQGSTFQPYNVAGLYGVPDLYRAKEGSSREGVTHFPRKTGPINGPGTGTSDSIPAMLSDGEFVFTAKAVRNMGGGSRRKGAAKMYKLMKMLEGGPIGRLKGVNK